jgi:hypothetical protein
MKKFASAVSVFVLMAGVVFAQKEDAKSGSQPKYYRLDFVVKEVEDGKVINGRSYSIIMQSGERSNAQIRTGNRVPVTMAGADSKVQYFDVGVNIDCRPAAPASMERTDFIQLESEGRLALTISAEVSSIAGSQEAAPASPPIVRQNTWSANVVIPIKKPTMVFSSDDATSKRKMQLEVTATPI